MAVAGVSPLQPLGYEGHSRGTATEPAWTGRLLPKAASLYEYIYFKE